MRQQQDGRSLYRRAGQKDNKFIAANARYQTLVAHESGKTRAEAPEQAVADFMPVKVVDLLEAIEIDENNGAFLIIWPDSRSSMQSARLG